MQVAVVGPTRSGKTVFLACLLRAAFARGSRRRMKVRPDPESPAAVELSERSGGVLCGELLPATQELTRYEFIVDLPGSRLFGLGAESLRLTLADPPGGDCMPRRGFQSNPQVVADLAAAEGLLLIVPANSDAPVDDLEPSLRQLLEDVRRVKGLTKGQHTFSRAAVAVTKSELVVAHEGTAALSAMEARAARDVVADIYGRTLLAAVAGAVPDGGDWYSLVSAFGFDARDGSVAGQRHADGWRLSSEIEASDAWLPYRVFEPIEFLARGVCWRERLDLGA